MEKETGGETERKGQDQNTAVETPQVEPQPTNTAVETPQVETQPTTPSLTEPEGESDPVPSPSSRVHWSDPLEIVHEVEDTHYSSETVRRRKLNRETFRANLQAAMIAQRNQAEAEAAARQEARARDQPRVRTALRGILRTPRVSQPEVRISQPPQPETATESTRMQSVLDQLNALVTPTDLVRGLSSPRLPATTAPSDRETSPTAYALSEGEIPSNLSLPSAFQTDDSFGPDLDELERLVPSLPAPSSSPAAVGDREKGSDVPSPDQPPRSSPPVRTSPEFGTLKVPRTSSVSDPAPALSRDPFADLDDVVSLITSSENTEETQELINQAHRRADAGLAPATRLLIELWREQIPSSISERNRGGQGPRRRGQSVPAGRGRGFERSRGHHRARSWHSSRGQREDRGRATRRDEPGFPQVPSYHPYPPPTYGPPPPPMMGPGYNPYSPYPPPFPPYQPPYGPGYYQGYPPYYPPTHQSYQDVYRPEREAHDREREARERELQQREKEITEREDKDREKRRNRNRRTHDREIAKGKRLPSGEYVSKRPRPDDDTSTGCKDPDPVTKKRRKDDDDDTGAGTQSGRIRMGDAGKDLESRIT
ncbi:hypothetical protein ABW19_dt0203763 [Dactylella cylindrospora]|nr:hypothetical protein ABW19_dt0203763 [Dactylella cylindrospora]